MEKNEKNHPIMATLDRQAVPGFFSSHHLYEMCQGLFAHFRTRPDNGTLLRMMVPENCLGCYFFVWLELSTSSITRTSKSLLATIRFTCIQLASQHLMK